MSDRKFQYSFYEEFVPPRCRKPRLRQVEGEMPYTFRRASSDEAPVAIVQHNLTRLPTGEHGHYGNGYMIVYRWHSGALYVPVRLANLVCLNGKRNRKATIKDVYCNISTCNLRSHDAVAQAMTENLDARWLLIDNVLHEKIGEPMYVVQTFGLGCNHGGTSIFIANHYNPNIPASSYFRINDYANAVERFNVIASNRGDTESLKTFRRYGDRIEVFMPQVLFRQPHKDHGNGDPFINTMERIITKVKNPGVAGILAMGMALKTDTH